MKSLKKTKRLSRSAPPTKPKVLKKKPKEQPRTQRPVPTIPSNFKWKGTKSTFAGKKVLHVLPKDMPKEFPRPNTTCPPGTVWRVDPKDPKSGLCLVTVMPGGLHVAWSDCGICHNTVQRCVCPNGFIGGRSIEWIYVKALADSEGDHFDSPQDVTSHKVQSRGLHWYVGKETGMVGYTAPRRPRNGTTAVRATKTLRKPAAPVSAAPATRKRLSKPAPVQAVAPLAPVKSLKQIEEHAAASEADATAAAMAALTGTKKKGLKRK